MLQSALINLSVPGSIADPVMINGTSFGGTRGPDKYTAKFALVSILACLLVHLASPGQCN